MKLSASITATLVPAMTLTGTLPNATAGAAYIGTLTLGGTFTAPVAIDASAGSIPSWMTPSVSGNTVTFSGTAPASAETDTFTVRATDSSATPQVATSDQVVKVSAAAGASEPLQMAGAIFGNVPNGTLPLSKAATAGSLLVLCTVGGSGVSAGAVPTGSGWTQQQHSGSWGTMVVNTYTKTAVGGETSIAIQYNGGTATGAEHMAAALQEWSGTLVGTVTGAHVVSSSATESFGFGPSSAAPSATAIPLLFAATQINSANPIFSMDAPWTLQDVAPHTDYSVMPAWRPAPNAAVSGTVNYTNYTYSQHCGWVVAWVEPT